jgi:hypothetical protein
MGLRAQGQRTDLESFFKSIFVTLLSSPSTNIMGLPRTREPKTPDLLLEAPPFSGLVPSLNQIDIRIIHCSQNNPRSDITVHLQHQGVEFLQGANRRSQTLLTGGSAE